MEGIFASVAGAMLAAIGYLYHRQEKLQKEHVRCQIAVERYRGEIDRLFALFEETKGSAADATIVADHTGSVIEWSPMATALFHWKTRQALGKHISMLMPQRYVTNFLTAWAKALNSGEAPRRGPFKVHGLTKDGREFPVAVSLSGWVDDGRRVFTAFFRRRSEIEPAPGPEQDNDENAAYGVEDGHQFG